MFGAGSLRKHNFLINDIRKKVPKYHSQLPLTGIYTDAMFEPVHPLRLVKQSTHIFRPKLSS